MEGVVPNSKVVIKPPPVIMVDVNEGNGNENNTGEPQLEPQAQGYWKKRLYLRPGNWIPWVTLTVVATMIVLSLIVLILHIHEKVMVCSFESEGKQAFAQLERNHVRRVLGCR